MVPCWCVKRADIDEDSGINIIFGTWAWVADVRSVFPNFGPLAAVGANIDVLAALEDLAAEFHVLFIVPNLFEGFAFKVAKGVLRIFIEAAGHYQAVPGDDRCMPEAPAVIVQAVLQSEFTIGLFVVTAVFSVCGDQSVGIILIVIDLCGLKADLVHPDLYGELADIVQLVFIGPDYEELKKDKRGLAFQLFFPSDDIACAFQYFFQPAPHPVLFINVLGGAVDGDDEAVQSALHRSPGVPVVEVMGVGRGSGIDAFGGGIGDHIEESGIEIRFALKIEDQV